MELSYWAATDVGRKREVNEDNFLIDKKLSLFIVADGMGGHASGEVASHLAVHEFRNFVEAGRDVVDRYTRDATSVRPQEILTLMEHAVQTATPPSARRRSSACWNRPSSRPVTPSITKGRPSRRSAAWAPPRRRC